MYSSKRTVTFFNMCFGDSFLIKDNNCGMLIDCGSMNQGTTRKRFMTNLISTRLNSLTGKKLLITHYHRDHINMIFELIKNGVVFNEIYVRDLSPAMLRFSFSSATLSLLLYAKITGDYKSFASWLNMPWLLANILAKGTTVYGVNSSYRNTITIGGSSANVLWPDLLANLPEELQKEINKNGESLFESFCSNEENVVVKMLLKSYDVLEKVLIKIGKEGVISKETVGDLLIEFNETNEMLVTDEEINNYLGMFEFESTFVKKVADIENRLSIVFEIDSKLLMCGDADDIALDNAMTKFKSNIGSKDVSFDIIKVPHHGTSNYYYSKFPCNQGTLYLIPNSRQHSGSGWSIDPRYTCLNTPTVNYCYSLNNSATSACPAAKTGRCRYGHSCILDSETFPF